MDPGRFHSGRWLLLAEGALVSAFGIAGLILATLRPHAGPTGASVLGLASTPAHSAVLLALGVVGIAGVGHRRAAVTVTALSAVAYTLLLFFSSVATARAVPTPLGFHAADIVLHGVLAAVNFALLMWLIPDELGDEVWAPRRGRGRDRRQAPASETVPSVAPATERGSPTAAATPDAQEIAHQSPSQYPVAREQASQPASITPPADDRGTRRTPLDRSSSQETNEPSPHKVDNSTQLNHAAARNTDGLLSRGVVPLGLAVLALAIIIWMRRR